MVNPSPLLLLICRIQFLQERTGLLLIFAILVGIMILWHLIGAIIIGVWGVEESKVLVKELETVFLKLIYDWDNNPRSSRILKQIQEYVSFSCNS
jgi:hypothetical protein